MTEEPGIRLVRVFEAPRERVWAEWTEPERFADWFGGPEGEVPLASVWMDVRPGGAWRLTMYPGPGGPEIRWAGEYLEVQPPSRLRFTVTDRPEEDRFELVTVVLSELSEDRTEMVFEQRGHMAAEEYRRAQRGWSSFFARVDERLRAAP